MKSLYLRALAAVIVALSLASCGGSSGTLVLGGTVVTLAKDGLVLINKNSGKTLTVASGATTFAFADLVANDESYDVEVQTQPTGAVCTPSNNTGKANLYNSDYIVITCVTDTHKLGGVLNGLTGAGLVLVNGSTTYSPAVPSPAGTSFNFTLGLVADGSYYGVSVLTQPAGQTCTVANATGTMGSVDITPLVVTCTP